MRLHLGKLIAVASLALATVGHAEPRSSVPRRVEAGDSLAVLAAEYYGDRRHAALLRLANAMDGDRELRPRERIRIPVGMRLVTEAGDRLETLATTHLDDERRAEFLADYNDIDPEVSLAAGELLRVPFHVELRADETTSLARIAARYMRGARDAELLRAYNFLDDEVEHVAEGDSILIPTLHIAVRSARMPQLTDQQIARVETRREAQAGAEAALPPARHAWRRGDYDAVIDKLAPLSLDFLDADVALEVSQFLGGAHLARGDEEAAEAVFRAALARDPDHEMSAYRFSPAIRSLWEALGGRVETSSR